MVTENRSTLVELLCWAPLALAMIVFSRFGSIEYRFVRAYINFTIQAKLVPGLSIIEWP